MTDNLYSGPDSCCWSEKWSKILIVLNRHILLNIKTICEILLLLKFNGILCTFELYIIAFFSKFKLLSGVVIDILLCDIVVLLFVCVFEINNCVSSKELIKPFPSWKEILRLSILAEFKLFSLLSRIFAPLISVLVLLSSNVFTLLALFAIISPAITVSDVSNKVSVQLLTKSIAKLISDNNMLPLPKFIAVSFDA